MAWGGHPARAGLAVRRRLRQGSGPVPALAVLVRVARGLVVPVPAALVAHRVLAAVPAAPAADSVLAVVPAAVVA